MHQQVIYKHPPFEITVTEDYAGRIINLPSSHRGLLAMSAVVLLGGGGHCRSVIDVIEQAGLFPS